MAGLLAFLLIMCGRFLSEVVLLLLLCSSYKVDHIDMHNGVGPTFAQNGEICLENKIYINKIIPLDDFNLLLLK